MAFHVGQKVVCVDDSGQCGPGGCVRAREIYTVRGIDPEYEHLGLYLEEIVLPPLGGKWKNPERSFKSNRFRPVIERKTDISIFTEMLNTKEQRVPVAVGDQS